MYLSHQTIERLVDEGNLIIEPAFDRKDIRPVGIRVHLAKEILVPEQGQTVEIGGGAEPRYREVNLVSEEFYLEPGEFVLGATHEAIQTPPDVLALLDGRSTVARLGLTTHVTASVCDGTFECPHVIVLEIKNVGNFRIRLKYKDPIGLMVFTQLTEPVTQRIQSQYGAGQSKVTPPNLAFKPGVDH